MFFFVYFCYTLSTPCFLLRTCLFQILCIWLALVTIAATSPNLLLVVPFGQVHLLVFDACLVRKHGIVMSWDCTILLGGTLLHHLFAVLLLPTHENCNRAVERGESDSSWSVVPFLFCHQYLACVLLEGKIEKGIGFSDFDFYAENLNTLIIILAVLDTFFLSRSTINYIH